MSVVATAAGVLGKLVAKPLTDAAMRQERVLRALKAVRLDPRKPPQDFDGIYAVALIEYCAGRAESVLAVFRDEYVVGSFRRSFELRDLTRVRREVAEAVERNRETGEFGHLGHGFEEHVDAFAAAFEQVVDRTRAPHEARLEETVKALLSQVSRTRDEEEGRRLRIEPGRAELTPAQRLARDAEEWFRAVGYEIRQGQWPVGEDAIALLVDIPRRRGRFDRTVMLCVAGELGPHHLNTLAGLADSTDAAEGWGIAPSRPRCWPIPSANWGRTTRCSSSWPPWSASTRTTAPGCWNWHTRAARAGRCSTACACSPRPMAIWRRRGWPDSTSGGSAPG
ncbi:hypothetical protein ACFYS8_15770 [Kitasatospora sp. NPDC004615]|uniref:hypothetical protein n=1 Tax=Kitasatospora sp. NPDC004615 TaxID=3364017 RepID=UPI0036C0ADC9